MKRRFLVLAALVVLAAVGWSGFWWFAADRVALFLDDRIEQARGGDIAISCPGRQIEGWPFRMEVSCPRLGLTNANGRIESGPVRAVALAYDPRHVILEADGPIDLRDSVSGIGLSARWATARASLRMREGRLAAAAVSTQTPTATLSGLPLDNGGSQRLAARQMEVHMRHSPRDTAPDGADLALTIDGLALEGALVTDSPLDGALLLHVRDAASLLGGDMDRFIGEMRAGGRPVAVEAAQLSLGSTRLSARGSLTLDTAGTLSGELDVTVVEPEGLARLLAPLFPRDSTLPTSFQGVMDGFGSTTTVDGHPALEARILVTKGQMRIGLVPFAQIPPLP